MKPKTKKTVPAKSKKPPETVDDRPAGSALWSASAGGMVGGLVGGWIPFSALQPGVREVVTVLALFLCLRVTIPTRAPKRARLGYGSAFMAGCMVGYVAMMGYQGIRAPSLWVSMLAVFALGLVGVYFSMRAPKAPQ